MWTASPSDPSVPSCHRGQAVPSCWASYTEPGHRKQPQWGVGCQAGSHHAQPGGNYRDKEPGEQSDGTASQLPLYRLVLSTEKQWHFQLLIL